MHNGRLQCWCFKGYFNKSPFLTEKDSLASILLYQERGLFLRIENNVVYCILLMEEERKKKRKKEKQKNERKKA